MREGEDFPDYDTNRRTVFLHEPLDKYLRENSNNVSGVVNRIMWDALGGKIPENGPEYRAADVRKRVLTMQLEAFRKERQQIEHYEEVLEEELENIKLMDGPAWDTRIDRIFKDFQKASNGTPSHQSVRNTDPDPDSDEYRNKDEEDGE